MWYRTAAEKHPWLNYPLSKDVPEGSVRRLHYTSDDELLDFMMAHPILINRPIVVTPMGTKLCRPSEAVLDILVEPQRSAFTKEDGEVVINEKGLRV